MLKKIKSITQPTTDRIADKSALILSKKCLISKEKNEFAGCREIWAQVLMVFFQEGGGGKATQWTNITINLINTSLK